jgi:hypothetical protein
MWQGVRIWPTSKRHATLDRAIHGLRDMRTPGAPPEMHRGEPAGERGRRGVRHALANLFKKEPDPVKIIQWKEIYEILEAATDRCEDVANVIEGVTLEHA